MFPSPMHEMFVFEMQPVLGLPGDQLNGRFLTFQTALQIAFYRRTMPVTPSRFDENTPEMRVAVTMGSPPLGNPMFCAERT
jgi:hypothetical protein